MTIQKQIETVHLALHRLEKIGLDPKEILDWLEGYLTKLWLSVDEGPRLKSSDVEFEQFHKTKDLNDALDRAYELGQAELARKPFWEDLWKSLAPLLKDVLFKAIVKGA